MTLPDAQPDPRPLVNIVVCDDEYGCRRWYHRGRNSGDVLRELQNVVPEAQRSRVQVTTAGCILGCTYGPRFDVARRWSGEKTLYGSISGEAAITRRGTVRFAPIPADIGRVVADNLPETAAAPTDLYGDAPPADVSLLREILLRCSRGADGVGVGLNEAVVMVHNPAATMSIPATLADLQFVDGSGQPREDGDIAVLATDGDGRVALQLGRVRQLEFLQRTLGNGMPSYAIWLRDDDLETVYRIYLRRSENVAANPLRHELFMSLIATYGARVTF